MVLHSHGYDRRCTGGDLGVLQENICDNDRLLSGTDRIQHNSVFDGSDRGNGTSFMGLYIQHFADCIGFISASHRRRGKLGRRGDVPGAFVPDMKGTGFWRIL